MPQNRNISLRRFNHEDVNRLSQLCNNTNIWDNLHDSFTFPFTEKEADQFITLTLKENPQTTFAIDYKNQLVGTIALIMQPLIYESTAEIGYWVGEKFWNNGIATQAVKEVINYGFENLKIEQICTRVFEHNSASHKILLKIGFAPMIPFMKNVVKNGEIIKECCYKIKNIKR